VQIPRQGLDRDTLFATLARYQEHDLDGRSGRAWAYAYDAGRDVEEVAKKAHSMLLSANGLDPTVYPSLARLENEVVRMAATHLAGDARVVGTFTSGGTESILLAVKAARDRARARQPDLAEPEMILPETAHAAFHKAAHYLGLRVVQTPVDPVTWRADVTAARHAVSPRTVMIVGSASSYGPGVVDPIRELAEIALERDLWMHVDGCIGGFLLPYFRRFGATFPDFDFSVPGVSSISMDFHKYAFAPKGASVVLYRDKDLRRHQIFACSRWTGYTVVNTAVQSSKSGGPLAAAWATLHYLGDQGYERLARRIYDTTQALCDGIVRIPGLELLVRPDMSLIAFTSREVSIFHLIDEMKVRGWYVQPQLGYGGHPAAAHLLVSPAHDRMVEPFLADLAAGVLAARGRPPSRLAETARQALFAIRPGDLRPELFSQFFELAGIHGTTLPERLAEVNEVLDSLPPELSERLLVEYMNDLFC
jgi:glutamate/tyrosine decarboxylase-like PLP-dependent enzyme